MDSEIKKKVLQIVKKVSKKTYEYAISQGYLEHECHDQNKEWEEASNAERKFILEKIQSEIRKNERLDLDMFVCMYLLHKDLEELDKVIQKRCSK